VPTASGEQLDRRELKFEEPIEDKSAFVVPDGAGIREGPITLFNAHGTTSFPGVGETGGLRTGRHETATPVYYSRQNFQARVFHCQEIRDCPHMKKSKRRRPHHSKCDQWIETDLKEALAYRSTKPFRPCPYCFKEGK